MNKKNVVLAIETAFAGGSVSLFYNKQEIARWVGSNDVSKSEDVLDEISFLLKKNKISLEQIKTIAISTDVGSLTGLRIGRALVGGLSKSLNCEYREVSIMKSLLINRENSGKVLTAIRVNEREIWYQIFYLNKDGLIEKLSSAERFEITELNKIIRETHFDIIIFHELLHNKNYKEQLSQLFAPAHQPFQVRVNLHENLSKYIGLDTN